MILKRYPEDFRVEERISLATTSGRHALYRMTKRDLGTVEAVRDVAATWNLPRSRFAWAGLKDRRAVAVQHVSATDAPHMDLQIPDVQLVYLGQTSRRIEPRDILANRFEITLRNLDAKEAERASNTAASSSRIGMPSYFDDQRFGSLGESGDYVGRAWCLRDHERALHLALAEPSPHDDEAEGEAKEILRAHWGRWEEAKAALPRSSRRSTVTYLVDHPTDFRGALTRTPREMRSLWLSAFQSAIWNEWLAGVVRELCPAEDLATITTRIGDLPVWRQLSEQVSGRLRALQLQLPSARTKISDPLLSSTLEQALATHDVPLRAMRIRDRGNSFFARAMRQATIAPTIECDEPVPDDAHPGHLALRVTFELPRGVYATLVCKRLVVA